MNFFKNSIVTEKLSMNFYENNLMDSGIGMIS